MDEEQGRWSRWYESIRWIKQNKKETLDREDFQEGLQLELKMGKTSNWDKTQSKGGGSEDPAYLPRVSRHVLEF